MARTWVLGAVAALALIGAAVAAADGCSGIDQCERCTLRRVGVGAHAERTTVCIRCAGGHVLSPSKLICCEWWGAKQASAPACSHTTYNSAADRPCLNNSKPACLRLRSPPKRQSVCSVAGPNWFKLRQTLELCGTRAPPRTQRISSR